MWQQPRENLLYHPRRPGDLDPDSFLSQVKRFIKPMPVTVLEAKGYLTTMLRDEEGITLQLVAEDYDVDIDHKLDEMRFHRSRVNLLTDITPAGVDGHLCLKTDIAPRVYTPFNEETPKVSMDGNLCQITLPPNCAYAVLRFPMEK